MNSLLWPSNILWCVCTTTSYPSICRWTSRLLPCPGYCKSGAWVFPPSCSDCLFSFKLRASLFAGWWVTFSLSLDIWDPVLWDWILLSLLLQQGFGHCSAGKEEPCSLLPGVIQVQLPHRLLISRVRCFLLLLAGARIQGHPSAFWFHPCWEGQKCLVTALFHVLQRHCGGITHYHSLQLSVRSFLTPHKWEGRGNVCPSRWGGSLDSPLGLCWQG